MEDNYFGNTSTKKSPAFYLALALVLVLFFVMLNTDLAQHSQHLDTGVPSWFFNVIFPIDVVIFASIILIFFYRKMGVYLLPIFSLLHHVMYEFYLSTTLLSGLHLLFVFIGAGLLVIVPRWRAFK